MKRYQFTNADREYQKQRDALIPEAEEFAKKTCPMGDDFKYLPGEWNRIFISKMQELAIKRGLVDA